MARTTKKRNARRAKRPSKSKVTDPQKDFVMGMTNKMMAQRQISGGGQVIEGTPNLITESDFPIPTQGDFIDGFTTAASLVLDITDRCLAKASIFGLLRMRRLARRMRDERDNNSVSSSL
jgi:hypothetical protein